MRVLMQARPGSGRILAGDAVQARATAAALRELGVRVDLSETDVLPDLAPYDLIHLFNLMPVEANRAAFEAARDARKPIVLSPIFWDPRKFLERWDKAGYFLSWWEKTEALRREVLGGVDLILPNAMAELECLRGAYGSLPRHHLVPNGVDITLFQPRPKRAVEPHVLCVARISARKNQLGLLEALRPTGLKVRIVGPVNDFEYYRLCRAAAWPGVSFLPEVSGRALATMYNEAPVHALVSWYETPGLASLEAAACGCRVVSTDEGSAREYLGDQAWYCRPDDADGIRRAVLAALQAQVPSRLAGRVREEYNWGQAARSTLAGYECALGKRGWTAG
ncbi:MAG: glycosyltransferase family 4 protein [Bacteroidota bacterium]